MKPELLKLALLHSNDIHVEFLVEVQKDQKKLIDVLGLLLGDISQVRA